MDADDDDFPTADDDFYIPGENEDLLTQWEDMLPPCKPKLNLSLYLLLLLMLLLCGHFFKAP